MILPALGTTAAASDVGVMSGTPDIGSERVIIDFLPIYSFNN